MATLADLRKRQEGMTQLQLATRLGVTPGTVYNWERGQGEPRASQVAALALALGVSADEIIRALPEQIEQSKKAAA